MKTTTLARRLLTTTLAALVGVCAAVSVQAQESAAAPAKGDAKAGEKKAAMCIGCHSIPGYQSSFPEVYKVPMISGQSPAYIVAALNAYAKGERKFPTMRSVAITLSEQDKADLAAYYAAQSTGEKLPEQLSPGEASQVAELLKKGNCQSCHGANLSKPIDPSYPKLAGQHADYLYFALKAYQTKNNPQVGRANAVMGGMAAPFSHDELKTLAKYIASLPSELQVVAQSRFK